MRTEGLRILVVIALVALAGCGGGQSTASPTVADLTPTATPMSTATASPTAEPTPTASPTAEPTPTASPTPADSDGDGLTDARESELGTDPTVADTDSDGLGDSREVTLGVDPTVADTDGDGLGDGREAHLGTNLTLVDTDGDSLTDAAEVNATTNATLADTDDDKLDDGRELKLGTNASVADTDGDGLSDGVEVTEPGNITDADPLHMDLFVELDYMAGQRPNRTALNLVVQRYANAPISNPDNESGITLHVVIDDEIASENQTTPETLLGIGRENFDNFAKGYYYGVFVVDARLDGNDTTGFATKTAMAIQHFEQTDEEAHIFMHELGHAVGLGEDVYRGIDSKAVPYSKYPSAMNYNSDFDVYRYATGANTTFDDWAYIEANFTQPPTLRLNGTAEGHVTPPEPSIRVVGAQQSR